jgi:hypothetical protein
MRRALFFIVAVFCAATSFASIPRASMLNRASEDASAFVAPLSETRVWASEVLAPFERPPVSELSRALHQAYADSSTTSTSGLGRFLSVDPGGSNPSRPQSWNRYAYVQNNPINAVDPDGREGVWYAEQLQCGAAATISFGSDIQGYGASLNGGGALGFAVDATLGTVGSIVQGYGDVLNFGSDAGRVMFEGGSGYDVGMAAAAEIGRASTVIGTVASVGQAAGAPSTVVRGTTVATADGAVTVRAGTVRSLAANGQGVVYRPAGSTSNAGAVRVAGPSARNPAGNARVYNSSGQPVVVSTGKPGSNPATHPALTGRATTTPVKPAVPSAPCRSDQSGCLQ